MDSFLTTTDAARLLGITPRHARLLCARGVLIARKVGRDWFVESISIDLYTTHPARKAGRPYSRSRGANPS